MAVRSRSANELGDVLSAQGKLAELLKPISAGTKIALSSPPDPGNAEWQRDLSVSWESSATCVGPRATYRAPQAFTEAKNIADKLAAADPGNAEWQRDLSVSWTARPCAGPREIWPAPSRPIPRQY